MAGQKITSEFARSYNSMSGSDIKAVFNGKVFGELQAISYAITREKAPIYTMGSPDPRSYSRNKRGIAGSFVSINYNEHSLLKHFQESLFLADTDDLRPDWVDPHGDNTDALTSTLSTVGVTRPIGSESEIGNTVFGDQAPARPWYADQVPPFDIVLVANNEYGASAKMRLIGVEILNDGLGVSIDDTVIESQSTFVCRTILPFEAVANPFRDPFSDKIATPTGQAGQ